MSKPYEEKILATQKDAEESFLTDGMDALSNRLDELRDGLSYKGFAAKIGMSESGVRKYFPPFLSLPTIDKALRIARVFNVNLEWLATGEGPKHPGDPLPVYRDTMPGTVAEHASLYAEQAAAFLEEYALIDGYHIRVSAGHGAFNQGQEVKRRLAFRRKWLKFRQLQPEHLAVVFAKGDSMEPTIHSGDTILIDTTKNQIQDGGLFVLRLGDELYAKRVQKRVDGGVNILSDNKAEYETMVVLPREMESLSIIGKVVWVGHDFF